ncbi:DUF2827 family protein [Luteimonas sp. RC10]|uniref:DUF2827 family protein n=1 Tax=Luteimonas sp. RC10 TaxID=2587035 RepID=UPI00161B8DEF|nr:DUF2827 family protein [Luteimonas sp. RC10]MBB3342165.1 hypothetical protein [Luteimonas sp. RC10]
MRIGISISSAHPHDAAEAAARRRALHMAQALSAVDTVEHVLLVDTAQVPQAMDEADPESLRFPVASQREATEQLDMLIEIGGQPDLEWLDYLRARGKRVVLHPPHPPYARLMEATIFDRPRGFARPRRCDEVWLLPRDAALAPTMRALHRCPVREVPLLWGPEFVDAQARVLQGQGIEFGSRCARVAREGVDLADTQAQHLRIACIASNTSVLDVALLPILIAEHAYRTGSAAIEHVHVLGSLHLRQHPTFAALSPHLRLVADDRLLLTGAQGFARYSAEHRIDMVIAHQWCRDQDATWLDVLYGGFALVHNSPWLHDAGVGAYYPGFDIDAGAERLAEAARECLAGFGAARLRELAFLGALHPQVPSNVAAFARLLAMAPAPLSEALA